jgi:hypothetical protein
MPDLRNDLRAYFDEVAPPIDIAAVTDTHLKPGPARAAR